MPRRRLSAPIEMPKRRAAAATPLVSRIHFLRQQRVILDADLAELYGVPVRQLNQQVRRNRGRFPKDFVFQLTPREDKALRSQFVISKKGKGGRRYSPYAFTEHGAIMAATVLNSDRAVQMSVFVVRAFVQLRVALSANRHLAEKIRELESRLDTNDETVREIFAAIRQLTAVPRNRMRQIGFQAPSLPSGPDRSGRAGKKLMR